jgi:dihydrofolate synthase/folylpolyglutamate synthase
VEVGLGGRLDSTNVLNAPVGVITTIELEHTDVLGPTISDVAAEKAGILHAGMRGIVGVVPPEALAVIEKHARSTGVPLWHLDREIRVGPRTLSPSGQRFSVTIPGRALDRVDLPLLGRFQASNAALAVASADAFLSAVSTSVDDKHFLRALKGTRWRGRLERVAKRPDLYLDVAHTPESAHAVAESLAEISPFEDPSENVLLFGCLQGKRTEEILDRLSPLARTVVLVPVASDRALGLGDLRLAALGRFPRIVQAPTVADGLKLARAATSPNGFTLAAGSDYLVGELLNTLEGTSPDQPDLADPVSAPPTSKRAPGRR